MGYMYPRIRTQAGSTGRVVLCSQAEPYPGTSLIRNHLDWTGADPYPRPSGVPRGGAFSYERGTPVLQEISHLRIAQRADFGDLMFFRTATDREVPLDQHRFLPLTMKLARFGDERSATTSREKPSSRTALLENCTTSHPTHHVTILQDWEPKSKSCLNGTRALYALRPSHTLGSFSLRSPILDIHRVKPRLRNGVPRPSESEAPRSSLYAPFS